MIAIRPNPFRWPLALAIVLATSAGVYAQAEGEPAAIQPEPAAAQEVPAAHLEAAQHAEPAPAAGEEAKPLVQTLGEADQKIFLVDHKGKWSIHAENVATNHILRLWQQAGGPEASMKVLLDRPFTMSVHALATEEILERLFEGYGYTLHYDDDGKLDSVRLYSPRPGFAYKTPRLTETLPRWKEVETDPEAAAARKSE